MKHIPFGVKLLCALLITSCLLVNFFPVIAKFAQAYLAINAHKALGVHAWQLLTSSFVISSLYKTAIVCIILIIVGTQVEYQLGTWRFLAFIFLNAFLCGVVAAVMQQWILPNMNRSIFLLGDSLWVSPMIYMSQAWKDRKVQLLFFPHTIGVRIFLWSWIILSLLSLIDSRSWAELTAAVFNIGGSLAFYFWNTRTRQSSKKKTQSGSSASLKLVHSSSDWN